MCVRVFWGIFFLFYPFISCHRTFAVVSSTTFMPPYLLTLPLKPNMQAYIFFPRSLLYMLISAFSCVRSFFSRIFLPFRFQTKYLNQYHSTVRLSVIIYEYSQECIYNIYTQTHTWQVYYQLQKRNIYIPTHAHTQIYR